MLMATVMFSSMGTTPSTVKYSQVLEYFETQQVKEFVLDWGTGDLDMVFQDGSTMSYKVPNVSLFYNDVMAPSALTGTSLIEDYDAQHPDQPMAYDVLAPKVTPWWVSMLPSLLLLGALIFFYVMMMRQARGGAGGVMSFGKAKPHTPEDVPKVTF